MSFRALVEKSPASGREPSEHDYPKILASAGSAPSEVERSRGSEYGRSVTVQPYILARGGSPSRGSEHERSETVLFLPQGISPLC